jgi:hypothetical protein
MSSFIVQIIRSVVPIVVGWVVGLLAAAAIPVPADIQAGLIVSLSTLVASLYYVGVAWLERSFPAFGWLLGVARNPVYAAKDEVAVVVPASATVSVELVGEPLTPEQVRAVEAADFEVPTLYESPTDSEGARY